jgi:hypothetical protein
MSPKHRERPGRAARPDCDRLPSYELLVAVRTQEFIIRLGLTKPCGSGCGQDRHHRR